MVGTAEDLDGYKFPARFWIGIPGPRRAIYEDYYQIAFDASGCPMKRVGDELRFHPILPAYMICDHVSAFETSRNPISLENAVHIAKLALKRADRIGSAVIFVYEPRDGLSYVPGRFYSALTQAWYIRALCRLQVHVPDFAVIIRGLFNSLTIPIDDGGVLVKKPYGWIVEEYPHAPRLYTLNGWLTALRLLTQVDSILESLELPVHELLERNLDAVEHLLPLFDAPFCLNSRYQLTGFSRIQIVFDRPVGFEVKDFFVTIPGEGRFPGHIGRGKKSRWENHLERRESRMLQFNVVLSLISEGEPNIFTLLLNLQEQCAVKVRIARGDYRPDSTGMPTDRWEMIGSAVLAAGADRLLEIPIPSDGIDMFAYPTNFKKVIGGRHYNGYHFVHIVDCVELYKYSRRPRLRTHALKWLEYRNAWNELPCLADSRYSVEPHLQYAGGFTKFVQDALTGR